MRTRLWRTVTGIVCALVLTVAVLCTGSLRPAEAKAAGDYLSGLNVHNPKSVVTILGGVALASKNVVEQSGMPFGSVVRASGTAIGEMKFAGGSECALQALSSPGAPKYGQVTTHVPPGALLSLNGGVANCTVSKAPQDLSVCYTGAVYDNSSQSQFDVSCTGDPLFAVSVLHGSVKVLTPNGKKSSVSAGKELTCNPAKCVPVTKRATFTPAQKNIFTMQAKQLGISPATTPTTAPTATIPTHGSPVTATVATAGQRPVFTFQGMKGQQVSFSYSGDTFPSNNDTVDVLDPDGYRVNYAELGSAHGFVPPVVLTSTGTYQVVVDASSTGDTGKVTVQLYEFTDKTGTIRPNGPAVTANVSSAGQTITYGFTGTRGEQVTLNYSGDTFPTSNDVINLLAPDGSNVASVYLTGSSGSLGPETLPSSGTYHVVVDTSQAGDTGAVSITLTTG